MSTAAASTAGVAGPACQAPSTVTAPTVVELYTSKGCRSWQPVDRWLSTLNGRPDVPTLAFYVNYWDRRVPRPRLHLPRNASRPSISAVGSPVWVGTATWCP